MLIFLLGTLIRGRQATTISQEISARRINEYQKDELRTSELASVAVFLGGVLYWYRDRLNNLLVFVLQGEKTKNSQRLRSVNEFWGSK